ncbi:DUF2480 family protein [Chryseobacterium paridis]|uniref:DUF2480 family protein n=1 Tax=Chryseobacterium paridis TaxID=2800328 RepID=A0ABS1FUI8_9FLAO|nr:DUF2480 family protein [Chryseobacterium paridis]MBK1896093.1 DUF2480 family protein [Chryseobacterium paridis]
MDQKVFINKAEASGIIAFDLWDYKPSIDIIEFDLKELLFMGMIVKEKEFKESISVLDFSIYAGKAVAIICSTDAIIPPWAYMLLMDKLSSYSVYTDIKNSEEILLDLWKKNLQSASMEQYKDLKVVVKARSETAPALYLLATQLLKPYVKSLMYGEIGLPKVIFKN